MDSAAKKLKQTDYGHERRLKILRDNPQDNTKYVDRPGFINVRRCQAKSKWSGGKQCGRFALKESNFCQFHPRGRKALTKKTKGANKVGPFANIMYVEGKSQKLKEMLQNSKKEGAEVLRLEDEINVVRMLADQALNLFDKTIVSNTSDVKVSPELRVAVMQNLRSAIGEVGKLTEKAANIYAKSDYCLNAYQVDTILNAVFKVIIKHVLERDETMCTNILNEITSLAGNFKEKEDVKTSEVQVGFEPDKIIDITP